MSNFFGNPAGSLEGKILENGWHVKQAIKKKPEDSGGHFSVCYIVEKENLRAFLKALDLTDAFQQQDFVAAINNLTTSFIFERELLFKCKKNHLSKIVVPIEYGQYAEVGQPSHLNVYYIIFEIADTNLRNQIAFMKKFDLAWILRSLHHTAVGMEQLHKSGIAHQDLKPSNVLVFKDESKIGDLGRSSDKSTPSRNDLFVVPGDKTYAPFELFYGIGSSGDFSLRFSSDLYHLGSLVFFYFLRLNLQQIILAELSKNDLIKNLTQVDFKADLPYFEQGFTFALKILEQEIGKYSRKLVVELIPLVKMLCKQNPFDRGHAINVEKDINQYSLERFISKFDILAKKAEYNLL